MVWSDPLSPLSYQNRRTWSDKMRHTFSDQHSVQGRTRNRKLSEQGEGREKEEEMKNDDILSPALAQNCGRDVIP